MTLPPFLSDGADLRLRVMRLHGEPRWWLTAGSSRALDHFLRSGLGRRWPLQALRARMALPAVGAAWRPDVAAWLRTIGHQPECALAVQLGSPGRYRKYVAMGLAGDQRPRWVLKASCTPDSRASIRADAEALRAVRNAMPAGVVVPRLFGVTEIGGVVFSLQEACPRPTSGRFHTWSDHHRRFCGSLFALPVTGAADWRTAVATREVVRLRIAALGGDARALADTCGRLLAFAVGALAGQAVRLGWVHRDFTPWNTLKRDNALAVVDWEWADSGWIPLHDALHFHLFPAIHAGADDPELWERFSGEQSPLTGLASDLGIAGPVAPYGALYLYDTLLFYADAIATDPSQRFSDPLLQRLKGLADRWVGRWQATVLAKAQA